MTPENRPRRRGTKPQASAEVARVLQIYHMLREELPADVDGGSVLAVAERIAARTEGL